MIKKYLVWSNISFFSEWVDASSIHTESVTVDEDKSTDFVIHGTAANSDENFEEGPKDDLPDPGEVSWIPVGMASIMIGLFLFFTKKNKRVI